MYFLKFSQILFFFMAQMYHIYSFTFCLMSYIVKYIMYFSIEVNFIFNFFIVSEQFFIFLFLYLLILKLSLYKLLTTLCHIFLLFLRFVPYFLFSIIFFLYLSVHSLLSVHFFCFFTMAND